MKVFYLIIYKVGLVLTYSGLFYLYIWFREADRYGDFTSGFWPPF